MAKTQPITPAEIVGAKQASIPDAVYKAFNELIAENFNGSYSIVLQCDATKRVLSKMSRSGLKSQDLFDKGWMDIEPIYRKAGWKVEYDKPDYTESYEPRYIFRKKTR